ncbi:hypothetical protein NKR23_g11655 [Pleurostoma richardsiae]|uniref:Uncharacterized protein n=1 Tax=Pleurostoma richardsiae TaxID=41990 RepID=A0AA38VDE5_9PEZI|nr:hypothetical protein NKR23_g11655 [Pleurostoma richardsiae]
MSHDYDSPPRKGYRSHSPGHLSGVTLGEDVDFVVGVTAAALAGNQLLHATESKRHKTGHVIGAGLGAAVAATAFTLMKREHDQRKHAERARSHEGRHQHDDHDRGVRGSSFEGRREDGWLAVRSPERRDWQDEGRRSPSGESYFSSSSPTDRHDYYRRARSLSPPPAPRHRRRSSIGDFIRNGSNYA